MSGSPALGWKGAWSGGWYAGNGRLRLESPLFALDPSPTPDPVNGFTMSTTPGGVFPDLVMTPVLELASVGGVTAPVDPAAGALTTDVTIDTDKETLVTVRAWNIPAGTQVTIRVVPVFGDEMITTTSALVASGQPDGSLEATALVVFPPGRNEIQLRANWTPAP